MNPISIGLKRFVIISLWSAVILGWIWHSRSSGNGFTESLQQLIDSVDGKWWAIPTYIAAYAARPLLLFPASLLTIAGGILFGPFIGVAVVVVAANLSAMIAFAIGYSLSKVPSGGEESVSLMSRWSGRLREKSFVTVLVMRLIYLPYDLVNYACGALRINPGSFLLATAIGSLPGTLSFVLAGASIDRIDEGVAGFDPYSFIASVLLFIASILGAKFFQRRQAATA